MNILRTSLVASLLALTAAGCVKTYKTTPPLAFRDYDYSSFDGTPWPLKRIALPETTANYQLARPLELAYVELNPEGEQTIIFVHGLGSYLKFWRAQLDVFARKGYRVIAVDLPGYGKSDKPATFPYTMEAMADAVRELATLVNAEKPIVAGHSMGGQTALSLAIRYPDAVSGLVLTSPAGFELFTTREKAWFKKAMARGLIKGSPEYGIWGSVRYSNFSRWRPELEWLIEERVRVVSTPEFDSYAYANVRTVEGLTRNDFVRDNLDKVTVPTLIVYGDQDRLIPNPFLHAGHVSEIMAYGHSKIAGSKLVELAGCGHTVQLDCPAEYNAAVAEFLAQ